jgi:hypothetical protein
MITLAFGVGNPEAMQGTQRLMLWLLWLLWLERARSSSDVVWLLHCYLWQGAAQARHVLAVAFGQRAWVGIHSIHHCRRLASSAPRSLAYAAAA